jgi:3'-phosphoadenosine 5'-phosphosulfate sulfotransferase (PAPS reductase)/FAD synthetase
MKTVNSVSGGQTSAYMMKHFPADKTLFALIEIEDRRCAPSDPWIKKYVEEKTNKEFIATLEDDIIVYTIADLEQYTGQEITFVPNMTFDEVLRTRKPLPNAIRRYCTQLMKVEPMARYCHEVFGEPVEMRLGFRANEQRRAKRQIEAYNENGFRVQKMVCGKHKNGNNKYETVEWARHRFPLIEAGVFKDQIQKYWQDKPVRFAQRNNCVTCFHNNPMLLHLVSKKFPEKYRWAEEWEKKKMSQKSKAGKSYGDWLRWRSDHDGTYEDFRKHRTQLTLDDMEGFSECDTGYCGL